MHKTDEKQTMKQKKNVKTEIKKTKLKKSPKRKKMKSKERNKPIHYKISKKNKCL